ncbi:MAG: deoxyribonuclease IV [Spirochaetaceae bacterium]|nr:MAG: deoxyribonuclease IV [Spirochaetaceae bacterium]
MKYIGAHVSASGGVEKAPLNAHEIGAHAFALFTKNQRQWKAKPLTAESIKQFSRNLEQSGIDSRFVLPHDSYLINIGSPKDETRQKSLAALEDELLRAGQLGLPGLNFHPGAHLNLSSEQECIETIAHGINAILNATADGPAAGASLIIETTAGQGSNVGYRFGQIADIIAQVENQSRVGVCIDTCHVFAAGYDIRSRDGWNAMMEEFDHTIGLGFLSGVHLNDAKVEFGSRKDRHHSLGEGTIGIDAFRFMMQDPRLDDMPLILETIDPDLWAREIATLYDFAGTRPQ